MAKLKTIENIYVPLLLRLYGFTLTQITDWTFMEDLVLRTLKKKITKNDVKNRVIHNTISNGVTYYISVLGFDCFFAFMSDYNSIENYNYFEYPDIMQDIFDGWEDAGINRHYLDRKLGETIGLFLYNYDNEEDIDKVSKMLMGKGAEHLTTLATEFAKGPAYASIRHSYGLEIADRLLHDRQISAFIALQLTKLAPREQVDGEYQSTQFVCRARWPAFVKPLIHARDRGKCANCKIDIASELLAQAHIDHIFALKKGGCNDVVNLQLLCEKCNRSKATSVWEIKTSVPKYHKRIADISKLERVPRYRKPWWR